MADLNGAKVIFLQSMERYPQRDSLLVKQCVAELKKYTDPKERRDSDIVRRANEAIAAAQSTRITASLASNVAILLLQVNVHAGSVAVEAMGKMMSPLRALRPDELLDADLRMAWARELAYQSIMAAACVSDLKRETLEGFCGDLSVKDITYLEALIQVTQNEHRKELVEALASLVIPGAAKLLVAAQFIDSVHQKANALSHNYRGYGAEDKLFALARTLDEQMLLFNEINESLGASTDAISAQSQVFREEDH